LVENLAGQDIAVSDIVKALEWAEAKCLELNKENEELGQKIEELYSELNTAAYSRDLD